MKKPAPELPFNPFVDIAVGNPWKSAEPDVKSINAKAYEGLLRLIKQLPKTPNLAALVLGSAGSGKTHLIKRLLQSQDVDALFVYVHPMKDHKRVFTTLMEHVSTNLSAHPPWLNDSVHITQLDLMVANVITDAFENYLNHNPDDQGKIYLKTLKKNPLKILSFNKSPKWKEILDNAQDFIRERSSFHSATSRRVLKAIFQYLDKSKREAVITFLSGTIPDQEECDALGLKYGEGDWSIEAQEQRSKDILKTIGGLLEFYRPMVLCFDQLDSMEIPEVVRAIGTLFMDIVNETENILPIGFVRPDNWDNRFKKHLDASADHRMTSQTFLLTGCDLEEALEIIRARLAWSFQSASVIPPNPWYPLERSALETGLIGATSPRDVLSIANNMITRGIQRQAPEDPKEIVKEQFEAERERLLSLGALEILRQDTFVAALKLYFENQRNRNGYQTTNIEVSGAGVRIHIKPATGKPKERTVYMHVETAAHWNPLVKSLTALKEQIAGRSSDFVFLIRDDRNHIPPKKGAMPKTVEKLREFENAGGHLYYVDYHVLSALYALVYTWDKVSAGDLSFVAGKNGEREAVDLAAFVGFVKEEFVCDLLKRLELQFLGAAPPERKEQLDQPPKKRKKSAQLSN